ncbi:MAG TPA: hypothetical protein VG033_02940 [Candidatus Acidoferrales bacterium]|jgi:hypothetical protein|nr:hypothetical protein [Candidatus Acidoferrales bacterium]
MNRLLQKLGGGDRRSIGASNEVVAEVLARPALFRLVFEGLEMGDALVQMRSADAVEKITRGRPELLQRYKKRILGTIAENNQPEVRWHVASMIPRLKLTARERGVAVDILFDYLHERSSIVKTCAMQGLAELAMKHAPLKVQVLPLLEELTETGTPAMRARGRKLLKQLRRRQAVRSMRVS